MAKVFNITLTAHQNPDSRDGKPEIFRVEKVIDSVKYLPGEMITKKEVHQLCADEAWKVIVLRSDPN